MKRAVAALLLGLAACSDSQPVVIDGSSPQAFERTVSAARRDLPVKDRLAFDAAIRSAPGRRYGERPDVVEKRARDTYDGLTAAEVVTLYR